MTDETRMIKESLNVNDELLTRNLRNRSQRVTI
jgi:hypothetical protein